MTSPPQKDPSTIPAAAHPSLVADASLVGLVSDTHGWLDPALLHHFDGVARIVHAGDIGRPEILDRLANVAPVTAVRGNIDGGPLHDLPLEAVLDIASRRIVVRHIAGSPRRPNAATRALVERTAADVLVVGHSHIHVVARLDRTGRPLPPDDPTTDGTLWINPGAAGRHGFHAERTAGVLEIAPDGRMRLLRIRLGPRGEDRARDG